MDFETGSNTFRLGITVYDSVGDGDSTTVDIQITNVNDIAPVFIPPTYSGTLSEAASIGDPVGGIRVFADDGGEEPGGVK